MKRVSVLWTKDKVRSECRINGNSDPLVDSVSFFSGHCTAHSVYVSVRGLHVDGHSYIPEAIGNGCPVVIHAEQLGAYDPKVLYIQHPNPRRIASLFANALAQPLPAHIIGVTGTDGKSTTCEFLWQLLNRCGVRCGLLSTVSMDDGSGKVPSPYRQSTPEAPQLYAFLRSCHLNGLDTVVLESTSHGLSEEGARLQDICYSGAIFTTLTSEHLEFHKDIESYVEAKMNLARQVLPTGWIVMPATFSRQERVEAIKPPTVPIYTFALDNPDTNATLHGTTERESLFSRSLNFPGELGLDIPFGPSCYAENALGALVAAMQVTALPLPDLLRRSPGLEGVHGRFEVIRKQDPCTIIIDFAHTADAFERLLSHVRKFHPDGRVIAVFGAAGERDRSKRIPMGTIAGSWCDSIILTDEDPRGEKANDILDDLELGIFAGGGSCAVERIHDRREAIARAISIARPPDIVLLLAKGHEGSIQYATHTVSWNEREVVDSILAGGGRHG